MLCCDLNNRTAPVSIGSRRHSRASRGHSRNSSAIRVEPKWGNEHIVWKHTFSAVPLRNNCHEKVIDDAEGALAEIVAKNWK